MDTSLNPLARAKILLKDAVRPTYRLLRAELAGVRWRLLGPSFAQTLEVDEPVDIKQIPFPRSECFPASGPVPWLDRPDADARIEDRLRARELTEAEADVCRRWSRDGYVILKVFDDARLDAAWSAYERAYERGDIHLPQSDSAADPYPGRLMNAHVSIPELQSLQRDPVLLRWLRLLVGRDPIPYQSIVYWKGSQQKAHSDAIHLSSHPHGYMNAAWIPFEDIHPDSGPLEYYPGSHRLPYAMSREVGIKQNEFMRDGDSVYVNKYEPFIERTVAQHGLKAVTTCPKKGEALLWHNNLIHGGAPRRNVKLSRKSVVYHYFSKGAVAYHDLANAYASPERLK